MIAPQSTKQQTSSSFHSSDIIKSENTIVVSKSTLAHAIVKRASHLLFEKGQSQLRIEAAGKTIPKALKASLLFKQKCNNMVQVSTYSLNIPKETNTHICQSKVVILITLAPQAKSKLESLRLWDI